MLRRRHRTRTGSTPGPLSASSLGHSHYFSLSLLPSSSSFAGASDRERSVCPQKARGGDSSPTHSTVRAKPHSTNDILLMPLRTFLFPRSDGSSGFLSSVWTGFGSVSVDPDFEPRRDPRRRSLGLRSAEKEKDPGPARFGFGAYTSVSPPPVGAQPLTRKAFSIRPPREGQIRAPQLNVMIPSSSALETSSAEPLALAGTEYRHAANISTRRDGGLEKEGSETSHMTTISGNIQSMEAL